MSDTPRTDAFVISRKPFQLPRSVAEDMHEAVRMGTAIRDYMAEYAEHARQLERELAEAKKDPGWTKASERHPAPHARYEVWRSDVGVFVATPCYGMHEPWWVPLVADRFAPGSIAIPFSDNDEWRAIRAAQEPKP